jgi:pimeloyl-ACP methyl ester carboxylesterase
VDSDLPLVILPGLDGTDVFIRPLAAALDNAVSVRVVTLPTSGPNGYHDLLPHVRQAVADLPAFHLLGWSFSGPLALMLASAEPGRVRSVILVASFIRAPQPALARCRFAVLTPVVWAVRAARRMPAWLLRAPADRVRRDKTETWSRVSAHTIAARVRAIADVDASHLLRAARCPVAYLAACQDTIVPAHNVDDILRVRPSVAVSRIDGAHFALYYHPGAAAAVVRSWLRTTGNA